MLRGAIIGVGNVAVAGHLPGWKNCTGVEIVAAADPRPGAREGLGAVLPGARAYESAEALFHFERLDFVDICTPPATHAGLVRSALRRGLHVLCEKPLVIDTGPFQELVADAREQARVLYTVHNWAHAPVLRKVRELVDQGAVGEVRRCRWETLRGRPAAAAGTNNWRIDPAIAGGGILVDHGWHAFYVLPGWVGGAPRQVCATLETRRHRDWPIEDTATICLEFASAIAEIFLTWAAEERRNRVEIEGTRGTIRVDGSMLELAGAAPGRGVARWEFSPPLSESSHHPDWFAAVARGFLAEVAEPSTRGVNLAEAEICVTLLTLALESGRRGGERLPVSTALLAETRRLGERQRGLP